MGKENRRERDGRVYGIEKQCVYVKSKMTKLVDRFTELGKGGHDGSSYVTSSVSRLCLKLLPFPPIYSEATGILYAVG
jgi:hypothetical protein